MTTKFMFARLWRYITLHHPSLPWSKATERAGHDAGGPRSSSGTGCTKRRKPLPKVQRICLSTAAIHDLAETR